MVLPILFILSFTFLNREGPPSLHVDEKFFPTSPKNQANSSLAFISVWNTELEGVSENNQIHLPLIINGCYNFMVEWGEGKMDNITHNWDSTHSYDSQDD